MRSNFYIQYYKDNQLIREDYPRKGKEEPGYGYCYSGFSISDLWKPIQDAVTGIFSRDYIKALQVFKGADTVGFKSEQINITYDGSFDQIRFIFTGWSDDNLKSDSCSFDSANIGAFWEWKFYTDGNNKCYQVTWTVNLNALDDGVPKTFNFIGHAMDDGWWQDSLASSMLDVTYSR